MKVLRSIELWVALSIVILIILSIFADRTHLIHFGFFVGPFRGNHWLAWIGTLYVAISVPLIAAQKKLHFKQIPNLTTLHTFGNLAAIFLISFHFAGQIDRPATAYPQLGTGLALYIDMILLLVTGFISKFNFISSVPLRNKRFFHIGLSFTFYIIIVIHILHGLNVI
jgi:hypothetical protein